ncbi:hypothetical protein DFH08DRAFT_1084454 [Mycena albidolilacea]|uniref:Uncharacterized protein n=1 Tax=Mycena albidolilacea TaxID=1033008 RepID=A0AAD6ZM72_9AGAR|nr:hypothetical protein DFH08DRAFT_1084454 [Mycena albidolilacea]
MARITPKQAAARCRFADSHIEWDAQKWDQVVFSGADPSVLPPPPPLPPCPPCTCTLRPFLTLPNTYALHPPPLSVPVPVPFRLATSSSPRHNASILSIYTTWRLIRAVVSLQQRDGDRRAVQQRRHFYLTNLLIPRRPISNSGHLARALSRYPAYPCLPAHAHFLNHSPTRTRPCLNALVPSHSVCSRVRLPRLLHYHLLPTPHTPVPGRCCPSALATSPRQHLPFPAPTALPAPSALPLPSPLASTSRALPGHDRGDRKRPLNATAQILRNVDLSPSAVRATNLPDVHPWDIQAVVAAPMPTTPSVTTATWIWNTAVPSAQIRPPTAD